METTALVLEEKGERGIDFDWLKEFLFKLDEEPNEVVVNKTEHKSKSSILSTPAMKSVEDEDDDDCVVLDGNPENHVTSFNDTPTGSGELFVVGEKGQVACRDYPHPRHLCVKFPFSSTLHERHCDQCHCYVCDSLAPCVKWGTGLSSTDHCHATDKSEMWITLRKNFRLGKTSPLPDSTNYGTLGDVTNAQHNQIMPLDIMLLYPNPMLLNHTSRSTATHTRSPLYLIPQNQAQRPIIMRTCSSLNSSLQNQVSMPNTVPEYSMATNFTIPNGANHSRCHESGSTLVRSRYQSHSVPRQLLGVRNHAIRRMRERGSSSLGPQFLHYHIMTNGAGCAGVGNTLTMNHSTHDASSCLNYHVSPTQQHDKYHAATRFPNNGPCYNGQNDVRIRKHLLYPHPSSESSNLATGYENQAYYQSSDSKKFYEYCIQGNDAPSSYVGGLSTHQVSNENQIGQQNENAYGGTTRQYSCQQKPHYESESESTIKGYFSALDSSRVEDTGLQSCESINTSPSVKESGTQFTGSTHLGSVDDIRHWHFDEENCVPVGGDGDLVSELNLPACSFLDLDNSIV